MANRSRSHPCGDRKEIDEHSLDAGRMRWICLPFSCSSLLGVQSDCHSNVCYPRVRKGSAGYVEVPSPKSDSALWASSSTLTVLHLHSNYLLEQMDASIDMNLLSMEQCEVGTLSADNLCLILLQANSKVYSGQSLDFKASLGLYKSLKLL